MLSYTLVDGFTDCDGAMTRLKEAIAEVHGMIVDFALYAGNAIRMSVELEAGELAHLGRALSSRRVMLFDQCTAEIAKTERVVPANKPVMALVHVTLTTCSA